MCSGRGIRAGYWGRLSVTVNHGALSTINACASGRRPGSSSSVASGEEFVSFYESTPACGNSLIRTFSSFS